MFKHLQSMKSIILYVLIFPGETGLGKSTLISSLFLNDLYKDRKVGTVDGMINEYITLSSFLFTKVPILL